MLLTKMETLVTWLIANPIQNSSSGQDIRTATNAYSWLLRRNFSRMIWSTWKTTCGAQEELNWLYSVCASRHRKVWLVQFSFGLWSGWPVISDQWPVSGKQRSVNWPPTIVYMISHSVQICTDFCWIVYKFVRKYGACLVQICTEVKVSK